MLSQMARFDSFLRLNQSILKEISPGISLERMMLKLKLQYLATSCKELTLWKGLWCWEGLGEGGEGGDRGWDGWMTSLTRWTRVWVNSGSWCWTGRPGMLQFIGSQRVRHDGASELNWTETLGFTVCSIKKNGFHICENRSLDLFQYIPPHKEWERLWHDQKLVRKLHKFPVAA